jgi:muramoyltetrapeptide carboxypeptidase
MLAIKLNKGDKIGLVSPSSPPNRDALQQGISSLEALGFTVVSGKYVHSTTWGYGASLQEKAEDINAMFADTSIKAIMAAAGGYTGASCLPYLDWEVIAANPKIFVGMSDITPLLNVIYVKTGLVTFHGTDVHSWSSISYEEQEFISRLANGEVGPLRKNSTWETVRSGQADGRLLGGNLNCLLKLAGTPYWPDFSDSILILEVVDQPPQACDHLITQLKQIGVFERVKGIVVGYIAGLQDREDAPIQMEDILLRLTPEYDFPILKINEFGHSCPNTVLPIGVKVSIDADQQEFEILEPCVRIGR